MMDKAYIEQMRAHVDEGGQLSHRNGVELLDEIERLRDVFAVLEYACEIEPASRRGVFVKGYVENDALAVVAFENWRERRSDNRTNETQGK